jgi:hypothetical protein
MSENLDDCARDNLQSKPRGSSTLPLHPALPSLRYHTSSILGFPYVQDQTHFGGRDEGYSSLFGAGVFELGQNLALALDQGLTMW